MARTKQTARKPRRPRKQLVSKLKRNPPTPTYFKDHSGRTYTVHGGHSTLYSGIFKLGIQLYCLGHPAPSPNALAEHLVNCDAITSSGNARNYRPRVDVHTGLGSVEECIEHHRREKAFRRRAVQDMRQEAVAGLSEEVAYEKLINEVRRQEPLPHIVPSWCPSPKFWRHSYDGTAHKS